MEGNMVLILILIILGIAVFAAALSRREVYYVIPEPQVRDGGRLGVFLLLLLGAFVFALVYFANAPPQ